MDNHDRITALMVLEYCMTQETLGDAFTGIDNGDLVWLAHEVLQRGRDGLASKQAAQLKHLEGTALVN